MAMRYRGRDFHESEIDYIRKLISEEGTQGRSHLSRRICEEFNWRKSDHKLKDMACRVALLQMEKAGIIQLPAPKRRYIVQTSITKTALGEPGAEVYGRVDYFSGVYLKKIENTPDSYLWNELIDRYHYLGYTRLGGAQIRYLVVSDEKILGCLGFSAAAWKTAPRDEFIGWSHETREKNLEKIANNTRFLILPWVKVMHLASKVLALAAKRLPSDWKARYGYEPVLLETFVEKERFLGTCYKAANWIYVGETKGRGRYDRYSKKSKPIKTIWLYPLNKNFRKSLCQ